MLGKENNGHTLQQEKYLKNPTLSPPSDEMRGEAGETFDSDRIQFSRQSRQHLPHDNQTETDSIHHQPFSDKMTNRQSEEEEEQKNIMTKHSEKKSSESDLVKFRYFCILKRGLYVFQFQSAIFTAKQKTMDVNRMFKSGIHLKEERLIPYFRRELPASEWTTDISLLYGILWNGLSAHQLRWLTYIYSLV